MLPTLLGLGISFGSLDTVEETNPTAGLGIGTAIWYIVSSLLSLFVGGWVAGRLASTPRLFDGVIHGVLTWCLVTLFTVYLLTTAVGRIIGGVSGLARTAGSGIAAAAPGLADQARAQLKKNDVDIDLSDLKGEVNQLLRETGKPGLRPEALERQAERAGDQAQNAAGRAASNPQAADETADGVLGQFIKRGEGVADQIDRNAAVNVVTK